MFGFRKTHVRTIEPQMMYMEKTFIAVPLPDGKILVLHGNFETTTDAEANLIVQNALNKVAS